MVQKGTDNKETTQKKAGVRRFYWFFDDEIQLVFYDDPLFSREALRDYTEKADKAGNNKRRIKQYVRKTKVEVKQREANLWSTER